MTAMIGLGGIIFVIGGLKLALVHGLAGGWLMTGAGLGAIAVVALFFLKEIAHNELHIDD